VTAYEEVILSQYPVTLFFRFVCVTKYGLLNTPYLVRSNFFCVKSYCAVVINLKMVSEIQAFFNQTDLKVLQINLFLPLSLIQIFH